MLLFQCFDKPFEEFFDDGCRKKKTKTNDGISIIEVLTPSMMENTK